MTKYADPIIFAAHASRMSDMELRHVIENMRPDETLDDFQQAVLDEAGLRRLLDDSRTPRH